MMAFANYDPVSFNEKVEEFAKHFRKEKYKSALVEMKKMKEEISKHEIKDRLKISLKDSELVVSFSASIMFENGIVQLKKDTMETLDSLIEILKISNTNNRILIEGHSDDVLKGTAYGSQWDISLSRAAEVAKRFEYYGFNPNNIVPIGRGDTQKIFESIDKNGKPISDNARLNRRVVIRVLEPYQKKKIKIGLGVYFRDAYENVNEKEVEESELENFEVKDKVYDD